MHPGRQNCPGLRTTGTEQTAVSGPREPGPEPETWFLLTNLCSWVSPTASLGLGCPIC